MKGAALISGLGGAITVTVLHESMKQVIPKAPRMDLLGMNALSRIMYKLGEAPPGGKELYWWTMAGDVVANSAYYALVGAGTRAGAWPRGGALGLAAGLGALLLPRPMGLPTAPSNRTTATQLMTVGLYLAGGLVTAALYRALTKRKKKENRPDPHLL